MASIDDVVVVAHPYQSTNGACSVPLPPTGGGMGGDGPNRQIRENHQLAENSVKIDKDVEDEEIVVIGRSIKAAHLGLSMQLTPGGEITLPCLGVKNKSQIRGLVLATQIHVKSKNFGPGRAGANFAASRGPIGVEINAQQLKDYSKLLGGINYLLLHEVAHSFKEMRDFNKSQFELFSAGAGKNLSHADRVAQYVFSTEFVETEARANAIAKSIAQQLNNITFLANPRHGTVTTC